MSLVLSASAFAIPNPASKNCANKGGTSTTIAGKDGEYSLCTFGKAQVEEWTLLRHNNGNTQTATMLFLTSKVMSKTAVEKCQKHKGTVLKEVTRDAVKINVCELSDGSKIELNTLYKGAGHKDNKKLAKALK